jgi:hypothetical protein
LLAPVSSVTVDLDLLLGADAFIHEELEDVAAMVAL